MPLITEQVHPLSLDFCNQRKVVARRTIFKESWNTIAGGVRNLKGESPSPKLVARVFNKFSKRGGRRRYKYKKCGRRPWKLTKEIQTWIIRRLRSLRRNSICTSTTLQLELAKAIQVEKYLFAVPTAITVNMSTHNLDFLEKHDWLGKPVNRVIVHWGGSGAAANV